MCNAFGKQQRTLCHNAPQCKQVHLGHNHLARNPRASKLQSAASSLHQRLWCRATKPHAQPIMGPPSSQIITKPLHFSTRTQIKARASSHSSHRAQHHRILWHSSSTHSMAPPHHIIQWHSSKEALHCNESWDCAGRTHAFSPAKWFNLCSGKFLS